MDWLEWDREVNWTGYSGTEELDTQVRQRKGTGYYMH